MKFCYSYHTPSRAAASCLFFPLRENISRENVTSPSPNPSIRVKGLLSAL